MWCLVSESWVELVVWPRRYWRETCVFAVVWERVIVRVFILLSLPSVSAFWSESRKASV
jgi:hypothetical protein